MVEKVEKKKAGEVGEAGMLNGGGEVGDLDGMEQIYLPLTAPVAAVNPK
jgi:hypothetical protein